jgi:hypothetical protein
MKKSGYYGKFCALLVLLFSALLFSQQNNAGIISGVIIDFKTKQPVEAVNFILTLLKDTSVVYGSASDKEGRFKINGVPFGVYNAKISRIGYKTRIRKGVVFSAKNHTIRLDTIELAPKNFITSEVLITGQKERLLKLDGKYILQPDRELGNNVLELMENSPGLTVDVDNNVTVFGKSAAIYIDGVPAKFHGIEKAEDLKMLSTSEIEKFELIIDPTAEFEETSRGGGAINIITRKLNSSRYNVRGGLDIDSKNLIGENLSGMFGTEKFSIRSGYRRDANKRDINSSSLKTLTYNNAVTSISQSGFSSNENSTNRGMVNFIYNLSKDESVSSGFSVTGANTDNDRMLNSLTSNGNAPEESFDKSKNLSAMDQNFFSSMIGYRKSFQQKGRSLLASIAYSRNRMERSNNIERNTGLSNFPETFISSLNRSYSDNTNSFAGLKINYRQPLPYEYMLTINLSSFFSKIQMRNNYFTMDPLSALYIENAGLKSNDNYNDNKSVLGVSLEGKTGAFSYGAGGSFYYKKADIENNVRSYSYSKEFFSFAPNFNISWNIAENDRLGLSSSRLIIYPMNKELSPYTDITDSTNIVSGNPDLKPANLITYSFGYNRRIDNSMIGFSTGYTKYNDLIEPFTELTSGNATKTTYKNSGFAEEFSLSGNFSLQPFNWANTDFSLNLEKAKHFGSIDNSETWRASSFFKLGLKFKVVFFNFFGLYRSAFYTTQGKKDPSFYMNASAKALFFNRSLSLTFRVSDVFNSMNNDDKKIGEGFVFVNKNSESSRVFSLGIDYYFQSKASEEVEEAPEGLSDEF